MRATAVDTVDLPAPAGPSMATSSARGARLVLLRVPTLSGAGGRPRSRGSWCRRVETVIRLRSPGAAASAATAAAMAIR